MGRIRVGEINLYYERHGRGEPLLLIEGLGYASWMWYRQVPELSRHFEVIVFDNRGVGGSDMPDEKYALADMAGDAAGLLSALGIPRAHLLGASMGGFIAQEMALRYPEKVDRIVLGCTSFGGRESIPIPEETRKAMFEVDGLDPEEVLRRNMALAFSPGYMKNNRGDFDRLISVRLANPVPRYSWLRQAEAALGHDTSSRLREITQPALVCTGDLDRVVPMENSVMLAARLPDARLEIFRGAGHLFFIEQPEAFNQMVMEFLQT